MCGSRRIPRHIVALALLVTGCGESGSQAPGVDATASKQLAPAIEFVEGSWPPQPVGMANSQMIPANGRETALQGVLSAARESVALNPAVQAVLGNYWSSKYREIEAALGESKASGVASFVFYSYANNETVIAELNKDGSVSTKIFSAATYQPPEHPKEREQAIYLFEDVLEDEGYIHNGYSNAVLAFPPLSNIGTDAHFYPSRVLNVTLEQWNRDAPYYSALVDLSNETVVEYRLVSR